MERYLLPIFYLVLGFNLCGISHRVTNIIGGICGIVLGLMLIF